MMLPNNYDDLKPLYVEALNLNFTQIEGSIDGGEVILYPITSVRKVFPTVASISTHSFEIRFDIAGYTFNTYGINNGIVSNDHHTLKILRFIP